MQEAAVEYRPGMPLMDVAQVVRLEQQVEAAGTPLLQLMLRAGKALASTVDARLRSEPSPITVLAGSGNNGGDGWVAAEELASKGHAVTLVTRDAAHQIKALPARTAANMAVGGACSGQVPLTIRINPSAEDLKSLLAGSAVILDCILGTGFAGAEVRQPFATWIELANEARRQRGTLVVAADVPSGLHAQEGTRASSCVKADMTVTMLTAKPGLLASSGRPYTGTLKLAPLGIDPADYQA